MKNRLSTRRLAAVAVLGGVLPLALTTAPGALAAARPPADRPCADTDYTNGQEFDLFTSPKPSEGAGRRGETAVRVRRGAEVELSARLLRGLNAGRAKYCKGERVSIEIRDRGERNYQQDGQAEGQYPVTGDLGVVRVRKLARDDFRFFANYNYSATRFGARSANTLVQVRP